MITPKSRGTKMLFKEPHSGRGPSPQILSRPVTSGMDRMSDTFLNLIPTIKMGKLRLREGK